MITIDPRFISVVPMTDLPVASDRALGFSRSRLVADALDANAFGSSGAPAVRTCGLLGLSPRERDERPLAALAAAGAVAAAAKATAYAAVSATTQKQTQQHHMMWAFRGLEPWSDPA